MKVKIKKTVGTTGDQRNFGLVTGSIWNYENKPSNNNVSTTLSPVERDEATIEAERGETIIGDLDNDGMVEHAIVGGKRHSQGGTPLNVPDGSFVFSDTPSMRIKNKNLLKDVFNMNSPKAGVTPAKVAKRYEINKYKDMLNDPMVDPLDQKTSQLMIDNNMKKLGQLALLQEGMKGFPNGIPEIALPLFANDQQATPPQMKKGGSVSYQMGGPKYQRNGVAVDHFDPQTGEPVYYGKTFNDVPVVASRTHQNINESLAKEIENNPGFQYWQDPNDSISNNWLGIEGPRHPRKLSQWQPGAVPVTYNQGIPEWGTDLALIGGIEAVAQGFPKLIGYIEKLYPTLKNLKPLDKVKEFAKTPLGKRLIAYPTVIGARHLGSYLFDEAEPDQVDIVNGSGSPVDSINTAFQKELNDKIKAAQVEAAKYQVTNPWADSISKVKSDSLKAIKAAADLKELQSQKDSTIKPVVNVPAKVKPVAKEIDHSLDDLSEEDTLYKRDGGGVYQTGGTQKFNQYLPETRLESNDVYDVIKVPTGYDYGKYATQYYDPNLGYYTAKTKDGKAASLPLDNFVERQGEVLKGYDGGIDTWKSHILSQNPADREKAAEWFQTNYNKYRKDLGLSEYFVKKDGANPYGIDKKFGIYTWSAPGLKKKTPAQVAATPAAPAPEQINIATPNWQRQNPTRRGYYYPDILRAEAVASQQIPEYANYLQQVTPEFVGYTPQDPYVEDILSAYNQQSTTGPQARASKVSSIPLDALAKRVYENRGENDRMGMTAQQQNAQVANAAQQFNQAGISEFVNQNNTNKTALYGDMNKKNASMAEAIAKLYETPYKQGLIEAMYPYMRFNQNGVEVNPTLKSIYDNPLATPDGSSFVDPMSIYNTAFQKALQANGGDRDAADKTARAVLQYYGGKNRNSGTGSALTSIYDLIQ